MVLGRANDADRAATLKRIKLKSVEVSGQRLLDQVVPSDPPVPRSAVESLQVRHLGRACETDSLQRRGVVTVAEVPLCVTPRSVCESRPVRRP
jgi:hypothetical protein